MIAGTYILAGVLLAISAFLFNAGALDAVTQTVCWCVIFFFASAGASAAYLTVSEIFPVEVRAKAIAVFFAIAQTFGAIGPWLYGMLIGTGQDHFKLFIGYLIGAAVMIVGGVVEIFLGVAAEGRSLEDIASPLSSAPATTGRPSPHLLERHRRPPGPGRPVERALRQASQADGATRPEPGSAGPGGRRGPGPPGPPR